jgi:hypothetical protein
MTTLALPTIHEPPFRRLVLLAPALMLALVALPLHYSVTLAEPDLVRMMAAMVYGGASGLVLDPPTHYGLAFSFGYYQLLYAVTPQDWLRDPDLVARVINGVGVFSGLLCATACTAYLARLYGTSGAIAAAILFFLSPMMLPVALSGHPLVLAAACLFAGGCLLLARRWLAALALLVAALSLRAEVALAFPFLCLADGEPQARVWRAALRALVLAAAFIVFLGLQHHYLDAHGAALAKLKEFAESFMALSQMRRGAGVLLLATGLATALAALVAWMRLGAWRERSLVLLLGAPALLLWLPNPTVARHFFFVVLAACVALGLKLARLRQGDLARAALIAVAIVVANQLVAELVRPAIVAHYPWSWEAPVARRAAQRVPLNAFAADQPANQALAALQREEAVRLAAQAPRRLLVLAGADEYFIAYFVARYPDVRWSESVWNGAFVTELASDTRRIVLLDKASAWPRDLTPEALARPEWRDWPVYVQRTTPSPYDRTAVPAGRRFELQ